MLIYNDYFPNYGVPYGIRTRVHTVRGCCPGPLDEGDLRRNWVFFSTHMELQQAVVALKIMRRVAVPRNNKEG